jgi:glutathione S-transferase
MSSPSLAAAAENHGSLNYTRRYFEVSERFSAPDSYLYTVLNWAPRLDIDLSRWPSLQAFMSRVRERPSVQAARQAEGLPA